MTRLHSWGKDEFVIPNGCVLEIDKSRMAYMRLPHYRITIERVPDRIDDVKDLIKELQ